MYIFQRIVRRLINNRYFESYLKIVKRDAESWKIIPTSGVGFKIYNSNKELIEMTYTYPKQTTVDTFYTNEAGYLITPEKLSSGIFYLQEIQAPHRIYFK